LTASSVFNRSSSFVIVESAIVVVLLVDVWFWSIVVCVWPNVSFVWPIVSFVWLVVSFVWLVVVKFNDVVVAAFYEVVSMDAYFESDSGLKTAFITNFI
jgi:hypothetical protein